VLAGEELDVARLSGYLRARSKSSTSSTPDPAPRARYSAKPGVISTHAGSQAVTSKNLHLQACLHRPHRTRRGRRGGVRSRSSQSFLPGSTQEVFWEDHDPTQLNRQAISARNIARRFSITRPSRNRRHALRRNNGSDRIDSASRYSHRSYRRSPHLQPKAITKPTKRARRFVGHTLTYGPGIQCGANTNSLLSVPT
jgi:hypothetical protein